MSNTNHTPPATSFFAKPGTLPAERDPLIAQMTCKRRESEGIEVFDPRTPETDYLVGRDTRGQLCWTCAEFTLNSRRHRGYSCVHIHAVRGFVAQERQALKAEANRTLPAELAGELHLPAAPEPVPLTTDHRPLATAFPTLLAKLSAPVPPALIKRRLGWEDRQGNPHYVDYVEWHTVADLLDRIYPAWSHSVRSVQQIGDFVAVTVALTIEGVTREGVGTGPAASEMGIKKAEHDALKRAAVKFGVARALYREEEDESEPRHNQAQDATRGGRAFPFHPKANSAEDAATPNQLAAIRTIGRAVGLDPAEVCAKLFECEVEELSRRAASRLIDHLKASQRAAGPVA